MRSAVLCLALASSSYGIHIPVQRRELDLRSSSRLSTRAPAGVVGLKNFYNQAFFAEVVVGGTNFTVLLDTGSSDLWFSPSSKFNQASASAKVYDNLPVDVRYGAGLAKGNVAQTDLSFAGFTITNQSFLHVNTLDPALISLQQDLPLLQGIIGLGLDPLSNIHRAVFNATGEMWGRSVLSNIFLANPSAPHHLAILLDRGGDLNDTDTASLDIGTYASGHEAIANQPKQAVFTGFTVGTVFWNTLVTKLTIGGKEQELKTGVVPNESIFLANAPPAGTISAMLDSGSSGAMIPPAAFKALYESMGGVLIKNDTWMNRSPVYAVPCMTEAQVEFTFGDQTISVHPLDIMAPTTNDFGDGKEVTVCTSTFVPGTAAMIGGDSDIVLGTAFLRNTYTLFNYGELNMTATGLAPGTPFVQMLPITNASTSSAQFKQVRGKSMATLPPEIDVKTINDPLPKVASGSSSGSGYVSTSGALPSIKSSFIPPTLAVFWMFAFLTLVSA